MKKTKRILAIIGIIILAGMYLSTLVFALMKHENASDMLMASIACTICKKINRGVGITNRLFEEPKRVIPCLDEGKMLVTYQRDVKLPKIFSKQIMNFLGKKLYCFFPQKRLY